MLHSLEYRFKVWIAQTLRRKTLTFRVSDHGDGKASNNCANGLQCGADSFLCVCRKRYLSLLRGCGLESKGNDQWKWTPLWFEVWDFTKIVQSVTSILISLATYKYPHCLTKNGISQVLRGHWYRTFGVVLWKPLDFLFMLGQAHH